MTTHARGFTLIELVTALIVVAVLVAVAVPLWRNHTLRVRRADAIAALVALQGAQDKFFGRNARYAGAAALTTPPPDGLGLTTISPSGFFEIDLRTGEDALGYTAFARARLLEGDPADSRCARMSIDQLGIRRATDSAGADRSADCWR